MAFTIHCEFFGNMDNTCVVVADEENKKLVIFDAPIGCAKILDEHPGYELAALIFTHGHYDHILGASVLQGKARQVIAHEGDRNMYEHPEGMVAWTDPGEAELLKPVKVSRYLRADVVFEVAGLTIDARHTPGHSQGGMTYYLPSLNAVVTGDSLFRQSVGRSDLPGGDQEELIGAIRKKILTLPDATRVFPGHGPESTVGFEKLHNPFLR
jgi:glyoxylase-like metal-dependent hydrolase (beta-lactamase superfamily II)